MKKFNNSTFKMVLDFMDKGNAEDLSTFAKSIEEHFSVLFDSDIEDIISYLDTQLNIKCDRELIEISEDKKEMLFEFINEIVADLYD